MEVKRHMRAEKVTFADVYKDFKARLPNLSKGVSHWQPNGYLSIRIFFWDGSQMVYDYLYKKGVFSILPGAVAKSR
jgi:hypothetical protein